MKSGITKGVKTLKVGLMIVLASGSFILLSSDNTSAQSSDEVYTVVDEMPEMVGGTASLYGEIKYPRAASRSGTEGQDVYLFSL